MTDLDDLYEYVFRMSHMSLRKSPVKKNLTFFKPCQEVTSERNTDENSVDIYSDLSLDCVYQENYSSPLKLNIHNFDEKSDQELKKLRLENERLIAENKKLEAVKIQLTQNISSLFATSKKQLQNKEKEINELRKIIDMKQGSYSDKIGHQDHFRDTTVEFRNEDEKSETDSKIKSASDKTRHCQSLKYEKASRNKLETSVVPAPHNDKLISLNCLTKSPFKDGIQMSSRSTVDRFSKLYESFDLRKKILFKHLKNEQNESKSSNEKEDSYCIHSSQRKLIENTKTLAVENCHLVGQQSISHDTKHLGEQTAKTQRNVFKLINMPKENSMLQKQTDKSKENVNLIKPNTMFVKHGEKKTFKQKHIPIEYIKIVKKQAKLKKRVTPTLEQNTDRNEQSIKPKEHINLETQSKVEMTFHRKVTERLTYSTSNNQDINQTFSLSKDSSKQGINTKYSIPQGILQQGINRIFSHSGEKPQALSQESEQQVISQTYDPMDSTCIADSKKTCYLDLKECTVVLADCKKLIQSDHQDEQFLSQSPTQSDQSISDFKLFEKSRALDLQGKVDPDSVKVASSKICVRSHSPQKSKKVDSSQNLTKKPELMKQNTERALSAKRKCVTLSTINSNEEYSTPVKKSKLSENNEMTKEVLSEAISHDLSNTDLSNKDQSNNTIVGTPTSSSSFTNQTCSFQINTNAGNKIFKDATQALRENVSLGHSSFYWSAFPKDNVFLASITEQKSTSSFTNIDSLVDEHENSQRGKITQNLIKPYCAQQDQFASDSKIEPVHSIKINNEDLQQKPKNLVRRHPENSQSESLAHLLFSKNLSKKSKEKSDDFETPGSNSSVSIESDKLSLLEDDSSKNRKRSKLESPAPFSTSIPNTPNMILNEDEEPTCTTCVSPCKPYDLPPEFYPPGDGATLQEKGSLAQPMCGLPEVIPETIGLSSFPTQSHDKEHHFLQIEQGVNNDKKSLDLCEAVIQQNNGTMASKKMKAQLELESGVALENMKGNSLKLWTSLVQEKFHKVFHKELSTFKEYN
ncbi:hypothetical protein BgiMline_032369 [Biomphalaria glabrata]|nr:hypothetical protein BgiMline_015387 [Biomphalaria glabrata]